MKKLMITLMVIFCVSIAGAQIPRYALDLEGVPQFEPPLPNISYVVREIGFAPNIMSHQGAWVSTGVDGKIDFFSTFERNQILKFGGLVYQPCRLQPDSSYTIGIVPVPTMSISLKRIRQGRIEDVPVDTFDLHSYVEDTYVRQLYAKRIEIDADMSNVTGYASDSIATLVAYSVNRISNNDTFRYRFDDVSMLKKIPFEIMISGDYGDRGGGIYDATHINYVSFSKDTNHLIFSNRHPVRPDSGQGWTGIGAIDMRTDSLKWIGWGHEIALDQPIEIVLQHDFKMIERGPYTGYYSVFNNGDDVLSSYTNIWAEQESSVLILDINFEVDSAFVIDNITLPGVYSRAAGNVIYDEKRIIVNHGASIDMVDSTHQNNVTVFDYQARKLSEHSLPSGYFSYNIEVSPNFTKKSSLDCESSGEVIGTPPFVWSNGDTGISSILDSGYVISEHISGFMREVLYFDCEREDTTSVTSEVVKKSLSIYPNPTNGAIFVKNFQNNQPYVMYDIAGKVVQEGTLQNQINISSLNSGMYILETKNVQHKIVVQ